MVLNINFCGSEKTRRMTEGEYPRWRGNTSQITEGQVKEPGMFTQSWERPGWVIMISVFEKFTGFHVDLTYVALKGMTRPCEWETL